MLLKSKALIVFHHHPDEPPLAFTRVLQLLGQGLRHEMKRSKEDSRFVITEDGAGLSASNSK